MINVSAINAFIIWQGINHENGNMRMRQRRKFLISLGKELCGITEEVHSVASISAIRNRNVTLTEKRASLNKRARCNLCDRKKNQKCQSLWCRCGSYMYPEHSDIVCITVISLILLLPLLLFLFLFMFICKCVQSLCYYLCFFASGFEVCVVIPVYLQVVWWFV